MNVHFEFLTQLRDKAGTDRVTLFLPPVKDNEYPTILQALKELEKHFIGKEKGIRVLENDRIRRGLMLFVRNLSGGLTRVSDPGDRELEDEQTIVLAAAMAGG